MVIRRQFVGVNCLFSCVGTTDLCHAVLPGSRSYFTSLRELLFLLLVPISLATPYLLPYCSLSLSSTPFLIESSPKFYLWWFLVKLSTGNFLVIYILSRSHTHGSGRFRCPPYSAGLLPMVSLFSTFSWVSGDITL